MDEYRIYTDGACLGNPGRGGIGVVVYLQDREIESIGMGYTYTTNNRMELRACIVALEKYGFKSEVTLITDSQYVKNGIEKWIINWKKNNWRTANKKPVLNKDLWLQLDALTTNLVHWEWVRGHTGDIGNERADFLAETAAHHGPYLTDEQ
ncbi:MAG: ribonuclease HI [Alphaproteobacteria bacterium]|nr:ribonuclease HI [Alphaproteobacteria bacterium]